MNEQLTDKILHTIKEQHIVPKPRWQFLVQRSLVWTAAGFAALLGSVSFSVMLFEVVNNDWEVLEYLPKPPITHVVTTLPYIWIGVLILFIGLAYYNVRHTRGAYKYHAYWLVAASIVFSMVVGGALYGFGLGPKIDRLLAERAPFLFRGPDDRILIWMQPQQGLLAGQVTTMLSGVGMFQLMSFDGNSWIIQPAQDFSMPRRFDPNVGDFVRVIGHIQGSQSDIFVASQVLPLYVGPGISQGVIPHHERMEIFYRFEK